MIVVSDDQPVKAQWTAEGLGLELNGECTIHARQTSGEVTRVADDEFPATVVTGMLHGQALREALEDLSADGREAMWEAIRLISPFVEKAVARAHAALSADVLGADGERLLSSVSLSQVCTSLTLGESGPLDQVPVVKIINRVLEPSSTIRVDPQRWMMVALNREAGSAVQRQAGDPRLGLKIRDVARSLRTRATTEEVLEAYRARYPSDRLGARRAAAALNVAPDPMASTWPLMPTGS